MHFAKNSLKVEVSDTFYMHFDTIALKNHNFNSLLTYAEQTKINDNLLLKD